MTRSREQLDEGLRHEKAGAFDRALERYAAALAEAESPAEQSEAWRRQAHVRRLRCDWDDAIEAARRAASIAASASLTGALAEALNAEAAVHQSRGDYDLARELYGRILNECADERIRGVLINSRPSKTNNGAPGGWGICSL